ncbi:MAG TPA: EAL domain-containing protein [Acidimicrobiales bacterium]
MESGDAPRRSRRLRPGDLGTSSGTSDQFNRQGTLSEATHLGVCREDRAQLETLARFAFANPAFRAVTTVRLGEDRSATARFEVWRDADGVICGLVPDSEPDSQPGVEATATVSAPVPALVPPPRVAAYPELGQLLEAMADETPDLMATFSPASWQMRWANPALREWLHVPAWASPPLVELLDEPSQGRFVVKVLPDLLSQGWWHGELDLVGPDTEPLGTTATLVAHRGVGGEIAALALTAQRVRPDRANRQRRTQDQQFAALVEHVSDLIAVVEAGGSIRYASPAAATMLGYQPGELTGRALLDLLHPDDRPEDGAFDIASLVRTDPDGNGEPVNLRLRAVDDSWCFIEAVVSDLTANSSIGGYVLNARDVTERVKAYEKLTDFVYNDHDTGLPNRLRLVDRLTTLLEAEAPGGIAVVLIDLDGFRQVNEEFGSAAGDALLQLVAARLVGAAGDGGMVARLRSDEFALTLSDVDEEGVALRAADALRVLLSHPFEVNGRVVHLTASVGVVLAALGDEADDLLGRADHAAGLAKRGGGNRTEMWGTDAAEREQRRRRVETQLRAVVEQGALPLDYQPIVSLADGTVTGAEALLRVRDGIGEMLNPAEFVEAAESSGLISRLGGQILQTTCEQLSRWDAQLRNLAPDYISVNISPRQLLDPGLATQVITALEASAIEPSRLCLELTESTVLSHEQIIGDRISFLRDLGVRVGLDEFGAGFSTLNYLKRFVIDFVKIDRSLIAGLGIDERDTAIVRATVQLAHSLGITVIAVGVETAAQLDEVRGLGCNAAQGYHFAAPRSAEVFGRELSTVLTVH